MKPQAKEAPINIRAKAEQRVLIDRAAQLVHKSRTDFMLEVACREAEDILLDQRLFTLNDEQYQEFLDVIDSPVSDNPKLARLLSSKSVWE